MGQPAHQRLGMLENVCVRSDETQTRRTNGKFSAFPGDLPGRETVNATTTQLLRLEPHHLLQAYRHGIFPMAVDDSGTIGWFSPDPRAVIPLDERFHIAHGLRRRLQR